ncbi:MAG: flagellar biosynthesis protein FlhF [Nitrospirae bacterium]|nr:flagellar biosynthesis protein FlhF [Nitrospirota bacterium]
MQIKRYEAVDMQDAIRQIKGDLGPDAVILSTKNVKKGDGVFGMFSRQVVEVVAARDYSDRPQEGGNSYKPSAGVNVTEGLLQDELQKIREGLSLTPGELKFMKSEIGLLKGYIQELLRGGEDEQTRGLNDNLILFYKRLVSEGIDRPLSYRIVQILENKLSQEQKNNMEEINRSGLELLQKQVKTTGPLFNQQKGQKIAIFIGPTGVGKTTTIAKIAAKYTLIDKKKVALITFDTFRVGAVEQLKIYAKIIGLPVDVVLSPSDLPAVIERKKDADLVLIDTAGRCQKDRIYINDLQELIRQTSVIDCHLVLSATSSDSVLSDIITRFGDIPVNGLLFTKLDEADKYGAIFSAMIRAQKPLSYFATGQRVPEDIELAAPARLCRLMLGMDAVNSH